VGAVDPPLVALGPAGLGNDAAGHR
jgi:hypothetical protein